ncbi:MAG: hypothetical protein Q4G23_03065 [Clostridia bacterium]|nr:hypothetical protein [Clostridia bacterium]
MYIPQKQYEPNASEINDLLERKKHEEEMEKALERLETVKRRKKKTFLCSLTGAVVGILYIVYIALGIEWIDRLLAELSGGNAIVRFILDFLPPLIITGIFAYFIARKEKGIITYIFSAISVFMVVLLVFLVYVSLMMR